MEKLDLRRELKYLYQPGTKQPVIVDVPTMRFLTIDGVGGVGQPEFQHIMRSTSATPTGRRRRSSRQS
jgi:hypothetical protein